MKDYEMKIIKKRKHLDELKRNDFLPGLEQENNTDPVFVENKLFLLEYQAKRTQVYGNDIHKCDNLFEFTDQDGNFHNDDKVYSEKIQYNINFVVEKNEVYEKYQLVFDEYWVVYFIICK